MRDHNVINAKREQARTMKLAGRVIPILIERLRDAEQLIQLERFEEAEAILRDERLPVDRWKELAACLHL